MPNKGSKILIGLVAISLGANGLLWWLIFHFFPLHSPAAVLHYTISSGVDFIGSGEQIKALPLIGLSLLCSNLVLGLMVVRASRTAAWIFWGSIPFIQLVLTAAFILLWGFNK